MATVYTRFVQADFHTSLGPIDCIGVSGGGFRIRRWDGSLNVIVACMYNKLQVHDDMMLVETSDEHFMLYSVADIFAVASEEHGVSTMPRELLRVPKDDWVGAKPSRSGIMLWRWDDKLAKQYPDRAPLAVAGGKIHVTCCTDGHVVCGGEPEHTPFVCITERAPMNKCLALFGRWLPECFMCDVTRVKHNGADVATLHGPAGCDASIFIDGRNVMHVGYDGARHVMTHTVVIKK